MNIAMASTWSARCGISTYALHLSKELSKLTKLIVLGEYPDIPGIDEAQVKGINVQFQHCFSRTSTSFDGILNAAIAHFDKGDEDEVDILHIQHEGLIFGWDKRIQTLFEKCKKSRIKTVATMHSTPIDPQYREKLLELLSCDKIIVHTEPAKKYWNDSRVVHINHGCIPLDTNVDKKTLRTKLKLDPDAYYVATTGYIGDLKGFREIIEILPEIRKIKPNAKLLYLGGIHPATKQFGQSYITDLARTLGRFNLTANDVTITGWIPESAMGDYLLTPDLYVLNYKPSGVYSATGAGSRIVGTKIPLVCADNTARLEELIDGVHCMKYPTGKMFDVIKFVMETPSFASKIAEGAYQYAVQNSWENIARQHLQLYEGF